MQTILGAGGAIGNSLAKELTNYTDQIRLVARNPKRVNPTDQLFQADLLNKDQLSKALEGSTIAYLTVGLPYKNSLWEKSWPLLIDNVIAACAAQNCQLVFFDNVYMYDANQLNGMTEKTTINPHTRKGKVRAIVAQKVLDVHASGKVKTLIARSADFYGPGIKNGMLNNLVIDKINAGSAPQWLCSEDQPHNFTYTPDAARATAQLGNDPTAYGRVWHLPSSQPHTANEWAQLAVKFAEKPEKSIRLLQPWMVKGLGLAMPTLAAVHEMLYQYDRPYHFKSDDFTAHYGWNATTSTSAMREIIEHQ